MAFLKISLSSLLSPLNIIKLVSELKFQIILPLNFSVKATAEAIVLFEKCRGVAIDVGDKMMNGAADAIVKTFTNSKGL